MYQKTTLLKPAHFNNSRQRHQFDAAGKVLGRIATGAAVLLRGKQKPGYTPYIDCGDYVDITNASKLRFTGKKLEQKHFFSHSGYAGGAKTTPLAHLMQKNPEKVVTLAVKRMLPDNRLRGKQLTRLRVYPNAKPGAAKAAAKKPAAKSPKEGG